MFDLNCCVRLVELQQVKLLVLDQCMFGCASIKPTMVLYANCASLSELALRRDHPQVLQQDLSGGQSYWASHPKAIGRYADCSFKATELARYPVELNLAVATALAEEILERDLPKLVLILFSGPADLMATSPFSCVSGALTRCKWMW